MYVRVTERRNKDGSVVRYLALAHNQRVDGTTKANVLLNLGREDRLDPGGLGRLVSSINRYLGEPDADGTDAAAATGTVVAAAGGLRLLGSRPAGAAWLLHGLWKALDVDVALRSSPLRTCSTSRSTCCSSTPPAPTSNATLKTPTPPPAAPTQQTAPASGSGSGGFRRYGHSKGSPVGSLVSLSASESTNRTRSASMG